MDRESYINRATGVDVAPNDNYPKFSREAYPHPNIEWAVMSCIQKYELAISMKLNGLSASEAGAVVGVGRNAIIGAWNRGRKHIYIEGLDADKVIGTFERKGGHPPKIKKTPIKAEKAPVRPAAVPVSLVEARSSTTDIRCDPVGFLDRTTFQCAWPLWLAHDTSSPSEKMCCGRPAPDPNRPYCDQHKKVAGAMYTSKAKYK